MKRFLRLLLADTDDVGVEYIPLSTMANSPPGETDKQVYADSDDAVLEQLGYTQGDPQIHFLESH
jgi:hypothetical protein